MAATTTVNVTIENNEFAAFIDTITSLGCFVVIVRSEVHHGAHAIFHLAASGNKHKQIERTVSVPGSSGEILQISWPDNSEPILHYENEVHVPDEDRHYIVKIL